MPPMVDLAGQRFGRLVVIAQVDNPGRKGVSWFCRCECGEEVVASSSNLRSGRTTSCGCFRREVAARVAATTHKKHGHARKGKRTPEYDAWQKMIARCTKPDHPAYPDYGGRGITVCDRWMTFENFIADMGKRPGPGFTLQRIDNDRGYEPGNCEWADWKAQARNRRPTRSKLGVPGVFWMEKRRKFRVDITVGGKRVFLGYFDNLDDAIDARREAERKYWGQQVS